MAHQQTRQANAVGAGIAVFTRDFSSLLWVNTPGAAFFGIDAPGPRPAREGVAGSPAARQLRAAARMLAAGATATRLRGPGGALVEAGVTRLDLQGHGDLVLVVVPPSSARSETPEAIARRLHDEAGIAQAEIRTRDGGRFFGAEGGDVDDATVAAFLATDAPWQVSEDGDPLVMVRLGDDHVLIYRPDLPEAAGQDAADTALSPEASADDVASDDAEPRRTGMSAILTRWYARHPGGETRQADAADDGADELPNDTTADAPADEIADLSDPAPPIETPANGEPVTPQKTRPLRSAWGPTVTFAEPEAAETPGQGDEMAAAESDDPTDMPASGPSVVEAPVDMPVDAEPATRQATAADFPELPVNDNSGGDETDLPEETPEADAPAAWQPPTSEETGRFEPRFDIASVRFVWRIDSEGRFRSLSPEFAAAVGPRSADVIDRSFADVARAYGLDPDGEVTRLLERRDTWSGRVVHWPVENSDRKAPVDLAALPVYARDRSFDGFRGFGIVRLAETVADPEMLGHALSGVAPGDDAPAAPAGADRADDLALPSPDDVVPFGRRAVPAQEREAAPKVIRLEERRRPRDGALSQAEEEAFRRIGQTLSDDEAPRGLEQAVRMAARRIEAFEGEETAAREPDEMPVADLDPPARDAASTPDDEDEDEPDAADEAARLAESDRRLLDELATVYAYLPLPVLVQVRETLAYGNREFFDLTGYADIDALAAEGGLAHLFADRDDQDAVAGEMTIRRVTGETIAVRTHMQRSTIADRSCLVMSFFASPGASVAAMLGRTETDEPVPDEEVKRLRHEVEELSTVLDTATDGVVFIDSAGNIRSMNGSAHALFGIAEDDSAGRPFVTLFAHESQKATMKYLESLRDGGASAIVNEGREVIGRVAQGGFIPLSITLGPLPDDRGWCAVIRDIAHWKRVEEELTSARRQAEAASVQKSQFLTNVSHELRTPLNAIIGFADVMATECFGPIGNDRYLEYLEDIKRSGHHVLDLVNDLLDISKIEAGKLDLSFEAVSLNAVMAEVVALMQPQANRERVLVRSNLPSSVPPVVADHRSIRQIAMNLVSNAIRFTPPGGQIIVSTSYVAEGDVALRFRDSGIGMSEHEIEIAMLPFQQVNPTSRRRGEGTGLGLPLTKAMVEANRANFAISSTPGEGTLVEILFPRQRVLAD